ncbi:uncharacterized protein [Bemisia tabaci]|uniref:uncharacterized protein isoform X2 n=1 Tax=Bemisia tabaci TaxID=7038 RepID=UPI003B2892DC
MWCVIVFKEDDTVGLIRQEWIVSNTPGEERTKYPPCTKRELIRKLLKISTPLQEVEKWATQAIIIKREAIESWPEALKLERMIADDSEGVSTDYEQLGRGHRVVKKRQMSDSDEENDHVMSTSVKPTRQPTAKRSAYDFANLEWPSCDVDESFGRYKIPSPLATSTQFVETECRKKSSAQSIRNPLSNKTNYDQRQRLPATPVQSSIAKPHAKTPCSNPSSASRPNLHQPKPLLQPQKSAPSVAANRPNLHQPRPLLQPQKPAPSVAANRSNPHQRRPVLQPQKPAPSVAANRSHPHRQIPVPPVNQSAGNKLVSERCPVGREELVKALNNFSTVIEKIDKMSNIVGNLTHRVAKLSTTVESLTKTVAEMDSKISDLLIQESTLTNDSLNEILPLATEKSLKTFNRDLSDVTYHLNFIKFLRTKVKDTIGDSMRAIANLLMTDDLALCYSWTGHKGKKPIKENTHLFSAIAKAIRTKFPNATDKEIFEPFKRWLAHAEERLNPGMYKKSQNGNDEENNNFEDDCHLENDDVFNDNNFDESVEDELPQGGEEDELPQGGEEDELPQGGEEDELPQGGEEDMNIHEDREEVPVERFSLNDDVQYAINELFDGPNSPLDDSMAATYFQDSQLY